jgi:hypothetical protein
LNLPMTPEESAVQETRIISLDEKERMLFHIYLILFIFSGSIKVDELEEDNYNDANYWKGLAHNVLSTDILADALRDLEL